MQLVGSPNLEHHWRISLYNFHETWNDSIAAEKFFLKIKKEYNFKKILEFGFGCGITARWFLETFKDSELTSFDIERYKDNNHNRISDLYINEYGNRFKFIHESFEKYENYITKDYFNLAFLDTSLTSRDGNMMEDKLTQIEICRKLKIPYILIDNIKKGNTGFNKVITFMSDITFLERFSYDVFSPSYVSKKYYTCFYKLDIKT
jgi:hypothetical protein